MLKHSRSFWAFVLIISALAGVLWLAKLSNSYRQCDADRKQNTTRYESANSHQERARRFLVCEGAFLDANKEVVTALATLAIAAFTLTLWLATSRQARLTRETIDLAREEFLAANRPKIVIHSVRLIQPRDAINDPLSVRFAIINAGTGAGTIVGSAVHFDFYHPSAPPYLPDLPRNDVVPPRPMDVGASDNAIEITSAKWRFGDLIRSATAGEHLCLAGWVVYEDGRHRARTTFFCRRYTHGLDKRFVPVDDPDYEKTY